MRCAPIVAIPKSVAFPIMSFGQTLQSSKVSCLHTVIILPILVTLAFLFITYIPFIYVNEEDTFLLMIATCYARRAPGA